VDRREIAAGEADEPARRRYKIFTTQIPLEVVMNRDQASGKWKQIRGRIKEQWGDLTDDELDKAEGNRDYLIGKVQERYGLSKEEVQRRLNEFDN
jgi:uncharacterized protein YjbJ (UPF0337 family)